MEIVLGHPKFATLPELVTNLSLVSHVPVY